MTPLESHGIAIMLLAVVALTLFSRDRIPMETSALLVLAVLVTGFELFPYVAEDGQRVRATDFLAGFGNAALITVMSLLVCTRALEVTGALHPVADRLARLWQRKPTVALLAALMLAFGLSMFLNNTPVVAMLLPILVGVSMRTGQPASSMLMPVGYATIIGGMCTTIGTSTNLLVVEVATNLGMPPMGIFHFTPVALAGAALGIVFLWLAAPRLLPTRTPPLPDTSPRVFEAVLRIVAGSAAEGMTVGALQEGMGDRLRLGAIERGAGLFLAGRPDVALAAGDRLYLRGTPEQLKRFEARLGARLHDPAAAGRAPARGKRLQAEGQRMAEIVVTRGSPLHRRTLESVPFFAYHGLLPVAVHRARSPGAEVSDIGKVFLRAGDIVLVQGSGEALDGVKRLGNVLVVDGSFDLPRTGKAPAAVGIIVAVVAVSASGLLPIQVAALCGVLATIISGCLDWRGALGALDRRLILVIVASLALGHALTVTGGTRYIADLFATATAPWPTIVALGGLMLVMALLTEVVTNNAAAVLGTPIAIFVAERLGVPPEPFVLAVLFGANMSYITPIGYQTNLMVLSAGGYRFTDFYRVGIPLQVIMWLGLTVFLGLAYGLI